MSTILNYKKWKKLYEQQDAIEKTSKLSPVIIEWQKSGKPADAYTVFYELPMTSDEDKLADLRGNSLSFKAGIDPIVKEAINKAIADINANSKNYAAAKTLATATTVGTLLSLPNNAGNSTASALKWMPTDSSGLAWNLVPLTNADKSKFSLI